MKREIIQQDHVHLVKHECAKRFNSLKASGVTFSWKWQNFTSILTLDQCLVKSTAQENKSSSFLSSSGQIQDLGNFISQTATGEMGSDEPMQN